MRAARGRLTLLKYVFWAVSESNGNELYNELYKYTNELVNEITNEISTKQCE